MNTAPNHSDTSKVAARFHELCSKGDYHTAMTELYAANARHVEAMDMPGAGCSRIVEGKPTLLQKAEQFNKSTTIHSASCSKPMVNDDQFVCEMTLDCTSSEGPMAGHRMNMREYCVYSVKNGKITEGRFFYATDMP